MFNPTIVVAYQCCMSREWAVCVGVNGCVGDRQWTMSGEGYRGVHECTIDTLPTPAQP